MDAETKKIAVKTTAISLTVALFCPIGCCLYFPILYRSQVPVLIAVETHPEIVEVYVDDKTMPEAEHRKFFVDSGVSPVNVKYKLKGGQMREFDILYSPMVDSSDIIYTDGKTVSQGYGVNVRPKAPLVLGTKQSTP